MTYGAVMATLTAHGYMIDVTLTDDELTAAGTTGASRKALRGPDHDAGPLVIPRDQITGAEWKPANPMVNGRLTVHHTAPVRGIQGKAIIHFRRKQQADMEPLARALGAL